METEQQWPDLALLGCCLISLHILCDILSTSPVAADTEVWSAFRVTVEYSDSFVLSKRTCLNWKSLDTVTFGFSDMTRLPIPEGASVTVTLTADYCTVSRTSNWPGNTLLLTLSYQLAHMDGEEVGNEKTNPNTQHKQQLFSDEQEGSLS